METLKILVFNWRCWFNPAVGGAEVFTCEVAKRWETLDSMLRLRDVTCFYVSKCISNLGEGHV